MNLIELFLIDPHALRYFGIIRFLDMPGYFPALALSNGDRA
jgi:hypothetical protein